MFNVVRKVFSNSVAHEMTDDEYELEMKRKAASLEAKRQAAITMLGEKWILHPNHKVNKKDLPDNTLGFNTA